MSSPMDSPIARIEVQVTESETLGILLRLNSLPELGQFASLWLAPPQPMEDRRGVNGTLGRCITVGDAQRQVPGVEWQGRPWADMFPVHPAPALPPQRDATDRWVWQYQANQPGRGGGDIYDGAWGAI
eukprot:COSAG01_NODE_20305_length_960_cov_1.610918_1_plen_127_part_10